MLKNSTVETCDLSNNLIKRIPSKFCTKLPSLTGEYDTVLSLYNAIFEVPLGMDIVISESFYKGKILQRNYRKMTIYGHFPIISL